MGIKSSLKLENSSQVSSSTTAVDHVDGLLNEAKEETKEDEKGHINVDILKSILKKAVLDPDDGEIKEEKKKVQWVDVIGKDLAEIREFESSGKDKRYGTDQSCDCVIL